MNADVIFFSDRISGIDWIFMGLSEHEQEIRRGTCRIRGRVESVLTDGKNIM